MATLKQKKLAKAVVENLQADKPLNKQELVVSSGYSVTTADGHANEILEQKGVQQELKEVYGFDTETAKQVVAEILIGGENDTVKLKAADMIFKVGGIYAAEKHVNFNLNASVNEKALSAAETAYLAQLDGDTRTTEST